jgi:hypothetical protein
MILKYFMNIGAGISKDTLLMGIFLLPPPSPTAHIAPINMISSFTSGSLRYFDPWVAPHLEDVDTYVASMPLNPVYITYYPI